MRLKKLVGWAGVMLFLIGFVHPSNGRADDFTTLHGFAGGTTDGGTPNGALVASTDGTVFYGMTTYGGGNFNGTGVVFEVSSDGGTYNLLHLFGESRVPDKDGILFQDGSFPYGSLVLSGSTLYGMTNEGGEYGAGILFSIKTDGTQCTILNSFGDSYVLADDGKGPKGTLILSGSTLYGMTDSSISTGKGVVFQIDTDGSNYNILHYFGDGSVPHDGYTPCDSLILSDSILYGMTQSGGTAGYGVVFKIDLSGQTPVYSIMHSFGDGKVAHDGHNPVGGLVLSGPTLYGMTQTGGAAGKGAVFSINTDGTKPAILHSFKDSAVAHDGYTPMGSLTLSGTDLFGVTSEGGVNGGGTAFAINPDGYYRLLHSFGDGTATNFGANPSGSLVLYGSTFYGMTNTLEELAGNVYMGTVYSFNTTTGYLLTVNETGAGSGTVTSNVSGIDCPSGTCSAPFAIESIVTLTAAADPGSTFDGWSGACAGKSSSCTVKMSKALTVTARFKANQTIGALSFNPTTLTMCGTTTVSATATSGLPVSFATTTPSVCKVSSTGVVTGLSMGTCTISANQGGNSNYNAAPRVKGNIAMAAPTFAASVNGGKIPLDVQFIVGSVLPSGAIASWHWSFGDGGTSAAKDPSHTYTKSGTFNVTLTLTSITGGEAVVTKTGYITVIPRPVADFTGTPISGKGSVDVTFTDKSTGAAGWSWNFGDKTPASSDESPTHLYSNAGEYTVDLTVTGPGGTGTMTRKNYIKVGYAAPEANFSATPTTGNCPLNVAFTAGSIGVTAWSWNFGDKSRTSTVQNPKHTYEKAGEYTVTLTVTGPGGTAHETSYITVNAVKP